VAGELDDHLPDRGRFLDRATVPGQRGGHRVPIAPGGEGGLSVARSGAHCPPTSAGGLAGAAAAGRATGCAFAAGAAAARGWSAPRRSSSLRARSLCESTASSGVRRTRALAKSPRDL
jgi:hypothetical protein